MKTGAFQGIAQVDGVRRGGTEWFPTVFARRRRRLLSLFGCGLLCALLSHPGSVAHAQAASPQLCDPGMPSYGDARTMKKLRTRAWDLFSTLTRNKPVFDSPKWVAREHAFEPKSEGRPGAGVDLFAAAALPNAGKIPPQPLTFESIFFNLAAVSHIHDQEFPLYSADTTMKLLDAVRTEIPEFPVDSMAVKTFWRLVNDDDKNPTRVGIWTWQGLKPGATRIFETADWPHQPAACVLVHPPRGSNCLKADDYFFTTTKRSNGPGFKCLIPVVPSVTCPTSLPDGQKLIMIGMHIASKEKPDWFWATFWWRGEKDMAGNKVRRTSGDSWTCDNAQRPRSLSKGRASYYSMDVTTSMTLRKPEVLGKEMNSCGTPATIGKHEELLAAFNPFSEGLLLSGRKSNCVNCHSRADTDTNASDTSFDVPNECTTPGKPDLKSFEGHIRTDYLWTINDFLAHTPLAAKPQP